MNELASATASDCVSGFDVTNLNMFLPFVTSSTTVRGLLILFLSGIITGFFPQLVLFPQLQAGNLMLSGLSVFIYSIIRYFLISYLGDAARYFSGNPEHVKMRNEILQDGIQFVKGLNDSGKYDRIILVGHSLEVSSHMTF